jgi:hypothetical protein
LTNYPVELLDEDADDGTMVTSKEDLEAAVVGHRIVAVEKTGGDPDLYSYHDGATITLDNGKRVKLVGHGDCCAITEVESFLLHPDRVDHIITGVGTTDSYSKWHIYADMGDVLELNVGWSCGNPFYYGYGFSIIVEDVEDE